MRQVLCVLVQVAMVVVACATEVQAGSPDDQKVGTHRVAANDTLVFPQAFQGSVQAAVEVIGEGDTDLEVFAVRVKGPYCHYSTACEVAEGLRECGYCTRIVKRGCYYYVYYQ